MKKNILLVALLSTVAIGAQIKTNQNISQNSIPNQTAFLDASSSTDWNGKPNVGKGLVFPRTDLTVLATLVATPNGIPASFPTRLDGMVVYNTGTGTSKVGNVSVKPGFYYYENKSTTDLHGGTWKPLGGTALPTTATNNQVLKWNGTAWVAADDANTTYTAGQGIDITSNKISVKSPVIDKTGNYTLTEAENNGYVYVNSAGAVTITVPSNLPVGFSCIVIQQGAGQVTIAGSGVTLQSARGTKTRKQYSAIGIIKRVAGEATITGDAVE